MTENLNLSVHALNELKKLLNKILDNKGGAKAKLVREFEDKLNEYWEQDKEIFNENISNVLSDLLNDVAYYQSNPAIRLTDKNLLDDNQLNELIRESFKKLEEH